jgi:DNA-directed RNA polymerase sigma subunit (sigma70/sigma32)
VPIRVHELRRLVLKASEQLSQQLGREPGLAEIAAEAGLSERRVAAVLRVPREAVPLEVEDGGPRYLPALRSVEGGACASPLREIERRELALVVDSLLGTLAPREAAVIRLRFGIHEPGERTLEEVGRMLQLSRERVRQIQALALKKLRRPASREGLERLRPA